MLVDHLDKLKAFKVVAESGKLREASVKLNLTQPSLTRLIQTLEETSGQVLFHRSRQGVTLTEAGQLLLDYASVVLKDLEDLEEKLRAPAAEMSGVLQVGSFESLVEYIWPVVLPRLRKNYPALKINIRTNTMVAQQKALEIGAIDLLVDAEPRLVGDFTSWVLYEDRFNFYARKGLVSDLTPESVGDLPLIYCPQAFDTDNKKILQHLEEAGYSFREKIELDSFSAVANFARQGIGLGVLPMRLAESSKGLVTVTVKGFSPARGFGAHTMYASVKGSAVGDKRVKVLVKGLREWLK